MRRLLLALIVVGAPFAAFPAADTLHQSSEQVRKETLARQAEQSKAVLAELSKSVYRAKMDIPAVDCIFVEDGKISEGPFRAALRDKPAAIKAGIVTKISSIKVMEFAIQIFFASDACALIGLRSSQIDTAKMTPKELLELAGKTIEPLFETVKLEAPAENKK